MSYTSKKRRDYIVRSYVLNNVIKVILLLNLSHVLAFRLMLMFWKEEKDRESSATNTLRSMPVDAF